MIDLSVYTEEDIYKMLEDGIITIDDLDYYIKDGTIDAKTIELYLKDGLIEVKDIAKYIKTGHINTSDIASYINTGVIAVDDVAEYIESGVINADELSVSVTGGVETSQIEAIQETKEQVIEEEPKVETVELSEEKPKEQPQVEEPEAKEVVEQPEEVPDAPSSNEPLVEQPEPVIGVNQPKIYIDVNSESYKEAESAMEEAYKYCIFAGMTIKDITLDGKGGRGPYISFEINNESKQMLDHLMNELYANNNGIALEFMRDLSTKTELFTIEIDPRNMSVEDFYAHVRNTFQMIQNTVQTTRRDFDYATNMPDGLKNIKDRFRNDDPDIGDDFTIGYVRNDGKDSYYIVADDNAKALEYARMIGYEIKNRQGSNVFELETNGSVVDTKLEDASVDLSGDKKVMDVATYGVADLDVYGSMEQDPRVEMIENFIETSNDPHLLCILDIEVPANNPSQRVVTMRSEMGGSETVVFSDGQAFDQKVMPQIIDTYAENNPIATSNVSTTSADALDRASCQVESENNTILSIRGYDEATVNKYVEHIESKKASSEISKENVNARQKTIGTYPTNNNSSDQAAAFVSMPVLFVICILFILMISLIIFAG